MDFIRKFYAVTPGQGTGGAADDANKQLSELAETVRILKDSFQSLGNLIKREITDNVRDADRATKDYAKSVASDLNNALKALGKRSSEILNNQEALQEGSLKLDTVLKQINRTQEKRRNIELDLQRALDAEIISATEFNTLKNEVLKKEAETLETLLLQAAQAERIEKTMGRVGQTFQGLARIPIVGKLVDAEKVVKRMQQAAADGASKIGVLGAGIKETFASIGRSLRDPAVIAAGLVTGFVKLVKLAAEFQSKAFETAKTLGVTVNEGEKLRKSFIETARANLGLAVTADQLEKSYAGVQNELGIIVKQSAEFNVASTLIERRTGATAQNMAALQFAAKKAGTSLMDAYKTIIGTAKAEGARLKLAMSEKQILDGISQVSATVYQNFKGNFGAIAAANMEAKKLGTTLDKINATQDQFLDFETSIAKQFEAEVLMGQEMDLTRARYLSLTHDTKGLMVEINRLVGSAAEFNKLDTITQEAKAQALGMSRETIHQMLMDQERTKVLGEAAGADLQTQYETLQKMGYSKTQMVELLGQESVMSAQTASVSEKLAATMDAIRKSIAEASTAFLPMINGVVSFLANAKNLRMVFSGLAAVIAGMAVYSLSIKSSTLATTVASNQYLASLVANNAALQQALVKAGLLAETTIVTAGASATAGSGYLGPGALAVGAAVIAGLMAYLGTGGLGGGSSAPAAAYPEIQPINAPAAIAQTNQAATATAAATAPVFNFKATTYVGTDNWSSQTRTSMQQDHGMTIK